MGGAAARVGVVSSSGNRGASAALCTGVEGTLLVFTRFEDAAFGFSLRGGCFSSDSGRDTVDESCA